LRSGAESKNSLTSTPSMAGCALPFISSDAGHSYWRHSSDIC
jgi:hypothetical protein